MLALNMRGFTQQGVVCPPSQPSSIASGMYICNSTLPQKDWSFPLHVFAWTPSKCTTTPYYSPIITPCGAYAMNQVHFWYRFNCFQAGQLGMVITPLDSSFDFNWDLVDITNVANPEDGFTNPALIVACNWSSNTFMNTPGGTSRTGTADTATNLFVCLSNPPFLNRSTFSAMPMLLEGHSYALDIAFTDGGFLGGFYLDLSRTTARFSADPPPKFKEVIASCGASTVSAIMTHGIDCTRFNPGNSQFTITPYSGHITAQTGIACAKGYSNSDTVLLTLSPPLEAGTYTLNGITLPGTLCSDIPLNDSIRFTITAAATPMDSLTTPGCSPSSLQLVFRDPIQCASIAKDGSDFVLSGPSSIKVVAASAVCDFNDITYGASLQLSGPVVKGGIYTLTLQQGSDGNTLINACNVATPVESALSFTAGDTVSAAFNYSISFNCIQDTIHLNYDIKNGVNNWYWLYGSQQSLLQNAVQVVSSNGSNTDHIVHEVSNGFCTDTVSTDIDLAISNAPVTAAFTFSELVCPGNGALFINTSSGAVARWNWNFGDGSVSAEQSPPMHPYPLPTSAKSYTVRLIVENQAGCADTAVNVVKVVPNCYLAVPSAFTPNGDGLNDLLGPLNVYKADNLDFKVFNRFGQTVFETKDPAKKWDGNFKSQPQPLGVYVWILTYTDHDTHEAIALKGTTTLIR